MEPLTRDDPAQIGGYRLHSRLGAGGMGLVYLAFTPGGRPVALKVVRPEFCNQTDFRSRFRQEVEAAQRVHGLYTAQLLDADAAVTPPWLVTAYVPGPSLQQAVNEHGPMPAQTVFALIGGMAEALLVIHSVGVVHRDFKPSNVILAPDGPRVIDFGIARAMEATAITRSGGIVGSPQFMAPEQVLSRPISPAIDVFALGAVAVYAATGKPPFGAGDPQAILYRVVHEPADLTGCPAELRPLIARCLEKDAAARPAPAEIVDSCRAWLGASTAELGKSWLPPAMAAEMDRHAAPPPPTRQDAARAPRPDSGQPARGGRRIPWAAVITATAAAALIVIIVAVAVLLPEARGSSSGNDHPAASGTQLRTSRPATTAASLIASASGTQLRTSRPVSASGRPATTAASPVASLSGAQCLPGTWSATIDQFIDDGSIGGESNVVFSGGAGYTVSFASSGTVTRDWDHSAPFVAQVSGNTWSMVIRGIVTARYVAASGELTYSAVSGSLTWTLDENGVYDSGSQSRILSMSPTAYLCSGSLLQLDDPSRGISTFNRA